MPDAIKSPLCAGLLFVMTVVFFAPAVFSDKTFIARDNYIFYNPRHYYAADIMKTGEIPLWNPYNACGVPFQANLQNALFYPATLIYYILPFQTGFKYYIIGHYFLAALCMFMLMRGWGKTRGAGLVAGIVFAFGGYMISLNEAIAFLAAGSWLPLVLLAHHYALKTCKTRYALLCGLLLAVQVFAGDFSFYVGSSLLCTFVYTVYRLLIEKEKRGLFQYSRLLLLAWLTAFLLAAVQILPFIQYIYHSIRYGGITYAQATRWSFSPVEIIELFIPQVLGTLVPQTKWAGQLWLDTIYSGIFTIILACLAVFFTRDSLKTFLLVLMFLGIFFALGEHNPVYEYFFNSIPFVRMVQYPVKFLFIAAFSLAALAGIGAQEFFNALNTVKKKLLFFTGLAPLCLIPALLLLCNTLYKNFFLECFANIYTNMSYLRPFMMAQYYKTWEGIAVLLGFTALFFIASYVFLIKGKYKALFVPFVTGVIFIDLLVPGKPPRPLVDTSLILEAPDTVRFLKKDASVFRMYSLLQFASKKNFLHHFYMPFDDVYRALKEGQQPNLNLYHAIQSADEYSEARNQKFSEVFNPVVSYYTRNFSQQTDARQWKQAKKILDLANVRYIASPFTAGEAGLELVKDGVIKIYKNPGALSRAVIYDTIYVMESDTDVVDFLTSDSFEPRRMVAVTQDEFTKTNQGLQNKTTGTNEPCVWMLRRTQSSPGTGRWRAALQNPDSASTEPLHWNTDCIEYTANEVRLEIDVNKNAFLYISDTYYPGWKGYINGDEVPIMRVNNAFRAIAVDKGHHRVAFIFRPVLFTVGACISVAALFGLLIACGCTYTRRQR